MRVLRIYHEGWNAQHRARDRALARLGVDVTLVVPTRWSGSRDTALPGDPPWEVVDVTRPGDVNRHAPRLSRDALAELVRRAEPDLVDLHEEPFSLSARAWLAAVGKTPVVAYTAQNVDKRLPPPFAQYERSALERLWGLYPCSSQAASVVWGKGFRGAVEVLPLGVDPGVFRQGRQSHADDVFTLAIVGRLVPEKGVIDAVHALASSHAVRPSRLRLVGSGPMATQARDEAHRLGLADRLDVHGGLSSAGVAEVLRTTHVLLAPSMSSRTWVEQFGRMATEGQACGAAVVGYASGALPEATGGAALLVREGDRAALQRAVRFVAASAQDWDEMRSAGLRHAESLSWDVVAARQVAFYERVLAMHGPVPTARANAASRADARDRYGLPAPLSGVERPFADPVLRRTGSLQVHLGSVLDAAVAISPHRHRRRTSS